MTDESRKIEVLERARRIRDSLRDRETRRTMLGIVGAYLFSVGLAYAVAVLG